MAQKALFVTVEDIKRKSIISGNLDPDKIIQFIEVAQDTHIQNYLGGKLYKKLQTLIINDTIGDAGNSDYKTLLDDYVKPMLIWFAQSNFLPYAAFQVGNGGLFKSKPDNSDSLTTEELNMLVNRTMETAEFYTRRFMDYMDYNNSKYPEYTSTANEDMHPDRDVNFHGWYLG